MNDNITCTKINKSIQNVVPESAPETISESAKCKKIPGGACTQTLLTHMENSLAPLDLIQTCCTPLGKLSK